MLLGNIFKILKTVFLTGILQKAGVREITI